MASLNKSDPMLDILLNQGKKYLSLQEDYEHLEEPHLKLIEQTTGKNLGSIIETLVSSSGVRKFTKLESTFNGLLKKYQTASEEHLKSVSSGSSKRASTSQLNEIKDINSKLMQVLEEMEDLVTSSGMDTSQTGTKLANKRRNIKSSSDNLMVSQTAYENNKNKLTSLSGEDEEGKIRTKSAYYNYLVWLIVAITLSAFAIRHVLKR